MVDGLYRMGNTLSLFCQAEGMLDSAKRAGKNYSSGYID